MTMAADTVIQWLLEGDPAVAWQVQRDLLDRAESTWMRTRRRVAREGWGAALLAERADDGTWGGGLYGPKWVSTFYTMRLLQHLGLPEGHPAGVESCELLLDRGVLDDGSVALWNSRKPDTCVTAMLLGMAVDFGLAEDERCERMIGSLLREQMSDGGWNCERNRGATHSSFHTSVSALEGLRAFEGRSDIAAACDRGREFFLEHQLYRSSTTGEVVRPAFTRFSFPPRWFFDVLRGLEAFAASGAPWDERLEDPVGLLERRRARDGTWKTQNRHSGLTFFDLEPTGKPGRMNTLRGLRVLRWLDRVR
jgi:hypothetical protein